MGSNRYIPLEHMTLAGDLYQVKQKIHLSIMDQHDQLEAQLEKERIQSIHILQIDFFSEILNLVSSYALKMVLQEYHSANSATSEDPLPPCTCSIRQTHGLPCSHEIFVMLSKKKSYS